MTETEDSEPTTEEQPTQVGAAPPPPPIRRLYRNGSGPIGGVATGMANYLGIDPVVAQIAFVALTVLGGAGILIYLAAWFLVPRINPDDISAPPSEPGPVSVVIGSVVALVAIGVLLAGVGFGFGGGNIIWLVLLIGGIFLLWQRPDEAAALRTSAADFLSPRSMGQPTPIPPPSGQAPSGQAPPGQASSASQGWAAPHTGSEVRLEDGAGTRTSSTALVSEPPQPLPPITSATLALAAVLVGIIAAIGQFTSTDIGSATLFGAVLACCGIGLVVASLRGRAWGLVPVGLVAAGGLALSPIADLSIRGGFGDRYHRISTISDLREDYELAGGELELDLRQLELDTDRTVKVSIGAGELIVVVAPDTNIDVDAKAKFGEVNVMNATHEGLDVQLHRVDEPTPGQPTLTIEAKAGFGVVEVRRG